MGVLDTGGAPKFGNQTPRADSLITSLITGREWSLGSLDWRAIYISVFQHIGSLPRRVRKKSTTQLFHKQSCGQSKHAQKNGRDRGVKSRNWM